MVLTRKRAASPGTACPPSVNGAGTTDRAMSHSLQSNLSLLASSASSQASSLKPETSVYSGNIVAKSNPGKLPTADISGLATSSSSNPLPEVLSAASSAGRMTAKRCEQALPELVQLSRTQMSPMSLPPASVVVSPVGTGVTVTAPGHSSSSQQVQMVQSSESNLQSNGSGQQEVQQQAGLQYRIVYHATKSDATSVQKHSETSTMNTVLNSITKTTSYNSATLGSPTTYAICVTPGKDGEATQRLFIPVSRAVSAPASAGANLLNLQIPIRSPVSATGLPTAVPVTARTSTVMLTGSQAAQSNNAGIEIKPVGTASLSCSKSLAPQPTVILPSTSGSEPDIAGQALYHLANTAKTAVTSEAGTSTSEVSAALTSTSNTPASVSAPSSDHGAGATAGTDGETTLSWYRQSILKLIQLYSEHQSFLKDPHYKKKSVWELIASKLRQSIPNSPPFRWNHVENKWKNMTKKYRDCIDVNHHSGTSYKCSYFDEISAIYSYCPDEDRKKAAEGLRALKSGTRKRSIALNDDGGLLKIGCVTDPDGVITKQEKLSEEDVSLRLGDASEVEPLLVKKKKYAHVQDKHHLTSVSLGTSKPASQFQPSLSPLNSCIGENTDSKNFSNTDIVSLVNELRADRAKLEQARMERLEQMHREKMTMFGKFLDVLTQSKQHS